MMIIFQNSCLVHRGVYSSIIPPPPWGGGKESKGLSAGEENQRRVEKIEFFFLPQSKVIILMREMVYLNF
jgi:hypothetical protein